MALANRMLCRVLSKRPGSLMSLQNPAQVAAAAAAMSTVSKIGNREVVGYGYNGQPNYADRLDFPLPAIRFKPTTPDIQVLREKEKGDWKKLSLEEKKTLYRASFCQTFSEMKAPTGEWKAIVGFILALSSISIWIYLGMKTFGNSFILLYYLKQGCPTFFFFFFFGLHGPYF